MLNLQLLQFFFSRLLSYFWDEPFFSGNNGGGYLFLILQVNFFYKNRRFYIEIKPS